MRVRAIGINQGDLIIRKGMNAQQGAPPCVLGWEVAGTTEAGPLGVGVPVIAWTRLGGYSEVISLPASQVRAMPAKLSFVEGAAFVVSALTAYHVLYWVGGARSGMTVLFHGAPAGVRLPARQLAPHLPTPLI